MTTPSHIIAGLLIGKITGDTASAVLVSTLIDVDHLISYAKNGVLRSPRLFLKTIFDTEDPYGDQRGYLHNVVIATLLCILSFFISLPFGTVFTCAYFGHLVMDALDESDYWPFYPYKQINVRGFVKYNSLIELGFSLVLIVVLITLYLI